jgi:DNA-binding winged helix-turn-helix (wHTH) protein
LKPVAEAHPIGGLWVTLVSLRRKLHDDAANSRVIFTEPGRGYRWIGEDEMEVPDR